MRFETDYYACPSHTIKLMLRRILVCCSFPVFCGVLAMCQITGFSIEPSIGVDKPVPIRVNSDLVQIPVTVLDRNDESIVGLEKERFRLFDDGVEQAITHFALEDAPISIGFVFDASASMHDKLHKSLDAVTNFLNIANPDDEFFLVQFNERAELAVDLTDSKREVQRQLSFIRPSGRTALLDAVHFSIRRMQKATNARRALIIISDGGDNCSVSTVTELKNLVREADVQIYALGIFDPWGAGSQTQEELAGPALLRGITKQSGGHLFEIENVNQLPDVASKIAEALRVQYVLGYAPQKQSRTGKYHRVEVKLLQFKRSQKLQASWRRGYYAPVE
jgi:Ca-activated chloride channel family protein